MDGRLITMVFAAIIALAVIGMLLSGCAPQPRPTVQAAQSGRVAPARNAAVVRVTAYALHMRDEPDADATVVGWLQLGDEGVVLAERGGWGLVRSSDGRAGWVNLAYTEPVR